MLLRRIRSCTLSLATLVLLSACSDAPEPTEQPSPTPPAALLPGQPTAKAITAVPDSTFRPRSQDYTTGHPGLPGMRVSFNTALVSMRLAGGIAAAPGCAAAEPPSPVNFATLAVTGRTSEGARQIATTAAIDGTVNFPYIAKLAGRGGSPAPARCRWRSRRA